MNLDNVKSLVELFFKSDYKDLFGALVLYESIDYLHDLVDVSQGDMEYEEELYDYYIENDNIKLTNVRELTEDFNSYKGYDI